ncbi:DUF2254 domain-containing protein [Sphingomonas sp. CJ99]
MKRWWWLCRQVMRRMGVRASLFSGFAVVLALIGYWLAPIVPDDLEARIGAGAVDGILNILATTMLAVTTFSLTAMVQAYASATSTITPRAVQLLIDDPLAQNALATFLGSFLFAIVGIVALAMGVYGNEGRVILFIGTIAVIAVIILTFLRWIDHVAHLGRVSETIVRIEQAGCKAAGTAGRAIRWSTADDAATGQPAGTPLCCDRIGRVTHVDVEALAELGEAHRLSIIIDAAPGAMVEPGRPLAWIVGDVTECRQALIDAFTIADGRRFYHDPRLSLVVLAETACRALSPAVNDPGTAISALESGARVMTALFDAEPDAGQTTGPVRMPPLMLADLLDDLVRPVARDGAGMVEVAIRIQKMLRSLARTRPEGLDGFIAMARSAEERARAALTHADDLAALDRAVSHRWPGGSSAGD